MIDYDRINKIKLHKSANIFLRLKTEETKKKLSVIKKETNSKSMDETINKLIDTYKDKK